MNSPPVGFHSPNFVRPGQGRHRPFRARRHQVVPPDVLFAQNVARLAGFAARSAQAPDPPPRDGAPEGGSPLGHHSARARLLLGVRRLFRRAKPILGPLLGRIARTLHKLLD